ncbi:MAG TPA: 16S rRNA (cytosine(1402)-N(4))-methyltransferase RsmH [Verrucomicrobiales bacterium]|nr:16S rRNA (cytosine(1402)-N(4))-methyltransferase RsmH [Verrucomicrobiales bacterium]
MWCNSVCEAGIAFGGAEAGGQFPAGPLLSRLAGLAAMAVGGGGKDRRGGSGAGRGGEAEEGYHKAVMLEEVMEWMRPREGAWILDCTLGGGGHSEAFLEAGACVAAIDRDLEAVQWSRARLARFGDRFSAYWGNAASFPELLGEEFAAPAFDGILMDLGVSSRQLDDAGRGFSFMREGPLAMTMDAGSGLTAEEVVNGWPEEELARVIWEYGEERAARRIAREMVRRRGLGRLRTTRELAECVAAVVPRQGKRHPATRTFQAIRMVVNDELGALRSMLGHTADWLRESGRLVVLSYHSLEDRETKGFLRLGSARWLDRPEWPGPRLNPGWVFRLPRRGAIRPSAEEAAANPRARSARLRVAERLTATGRENS